MSWVLFIFSALLTAGVTIKVTSSLDNKDRRLQTILAVIIPLVALPLYLLLGSPQLKGQPVIFHDLIERDMRQMALLSARPLETLINKNPNDGYALSALGKISMRLEKFEAAEGFLERAVAHLPKKSDAYAFALLDLALAQVARNNGIVTAQALKNFEDVRIVNPMGSLPRHYIALYKAQHGDHATALQEWTELLRDVSGNIYWKKTVREEMAKSRAFLQAQNK